MLVDLNVEELQKYMGTNPCPKDFDEYWDRALKEADELDLNVEFIKKDFPGKNVDYFELYFTGTKGARIFAKVAIPQNKEEKMPAMLLFHGLSGSSCDWCGLNGYASQGYVVASLDTRGQGGQSEDVGGVKGSTFSTPFMRGIDGEVDNLYMRDSFLDTYILAKIIMGLDCVDESRVGVTGGSQGGGLSIACAALMPKIKKCFVCYPYLSDYKRVYMLDLNKDAYEGLKYYFRNFDPTHEREEEVFTKLGYIDIQYLAKRIKAEVKMSTGLMDTICPPSTQFAMYNKLTCKKSFLIYPEYGHERFKGNSDIEFKFFADL